VVASLV